MPVVARLSKHLYDRLGEQIANELVELFNQMDAASRADLRELNELNFARFDAKLEQRIAETNETIKGLEIRLTARMEVFAAATKVDLAEGFAEQSRYIEQRFTSQTRFLYLAMAMQLAATLSLWLH